MSSLRLLFVAPLSFLFSLSLFAGSADWMQRLNDATYVSQLSIPGTHDSGTGHGFQGTLGILGDSYARTQDKTITEQWESGIRAFDFRPAVDGSTLRIYHGVIKTKLTLETALQTLCSLLDAHPTELAFVFLRHETEGDDGNSNWGTLVTQLLQTEQLQAHTVPFTPLITVGQTRGKLMIISRDAYASTPVTGCFATAWSHDANINNQHSGQFQGVGTDNRAPYYVQDYYDCTGSDGKAVKQQAIQTLLDYSMFRNSSKKTWFINHTSGYSKTVSLFGSTLSTSDGYRDNAATQNAAVAAYLADHAGPTGFVMMDFAGTDRSSGYDVLSQTLTDALIENNFRFEPWGTDNDVPLSSPYTGVSRTRGTFYIYNVETGLWLQNNRRRQEFWTTRAELDEQGLDITLTALADGGIQLNPNFGGNNSIDAADYYMDTDRPVCSWTLTSKTVDGIKNCFTITSGTTTLSADADGNLAQDGRRNTWQLVTKSERLLYLRKATADAPRDATWLIPYFDFAHMNQRYLLWTNEADGGNNLDGGNPDWARANRGHESWNSSSFNYSYTLTGLPNGVYRFTLQGFYRDGSCDNAEWTGVVGQKHHAGTEQQRAYFFAADQRQPLLSICQPAKTQAEEHAFERASDGIFLPDNLDCAVNAMALGYYQNPELEVIVRDGTLSIGVAKDSGVGDDWTVFDNLRLTYYGPALNDAVIDLPAEPEASASLDADSSSAVYNLAGQRIAPSSSLHRGVYLLRGRKVFIP